jgi:hypothetical protein
VLALWEQTLAPQAAAEEVPENGVRAERPTELPTGELAHRQRQFRNARKMLVRHPADCHNFRKNRPSMPPEFSRANAILDFYIVTEPSGWDKLDLLFSCAASYARR